MWCLSLQVMVDGRDIKSLQLKWLRGQIGIVNQVRDRLSGPRSCTVQGLTRCTLIRQCTIARVQSAPSSTCSLRNNRSALYSLQKQRTLPEHSLGRRSRRSRSSSQPTFSRTSLLGSGTPTSKK